MCIRDRELGAIVLVLVTSAFDAVRDGIMKTGSWWERHTVKWVAFYSPLIFITVVHIRWEYWIPLSIASWIVWRLSIRYIGGQEWESHWVRHIKGFFN